MLTEEESLRNVNAKVDVFDAVFQSDYFELLPVNDDKDARPIKLLVGSIDQGTSSTKFIIYTQRTGRIAAIGQMEHQQHYPQTGWHEHDPMDLWNNTLKCIKAVYDKFVITYPNHQLKLAAIGITNQRETTIAWNRVSGIPYYNAIVWDCCRTSAIADDLISCGGKDRFRDKTGLPVSSYFAGTKVKWLLDNVQALRTDLLTKPNEVCFGTVDTWLLYNLTGRECYKTDVSNASRWLFLDIRTCQWDQQLVNTICAPHNVPCKLVLPEINPSSCILGYCKLDEQQIRNTSDAELLPEVLLNVPIASLIGDQQAALFGHGAFQPGQAKNTVC